MVFIYRNLENSFTVDFFHPYFLYMFLYIFLYIFSLNFFFLYRYVQEIRNHYGEEIAFYFAYTNFYSKVSWKQILSNPTNFLSLVVIVLPFLLIVLLPFFPFHTSISLIHSFGIKFLWPLAILGLLWGLNQYRVNDNTYKRGLSLYGYLTACVWAPLFVKFWKR